MCTCTYWCMWLAEVNAVSSPTAFYLIFIYFLNIYLFSAYVMGMHVPWHTRVGYGLKDNFQELVLSFQLVGPKDRTQATVHTHSFKKYLFMCVRGSMCVLQCVDWRSGDNLSERVLLPIWVPEISLRLSGLAAGIFNLLSHLDMSGSPHPISAEDQTWVIMLTRKVLYKLSHLSRPCVFLSVDSLTPKSILLSHSRLMAPW